MKFRVALAAVLVAGLTASFAVAAPAKTSKKPTGTTATTTTTTTTTKKTNKRVVCRPNVALILKGKLVSIADDQLSFTMDVKQTNKHARSYKGKTVTVQVNAKTKIMRLGKRVALGALIIGDRLDVQARVCKKSTGETAPPLAVRVVAKPAKAAPTTTTTTTT